MSTDAGVEEKAQVKEETTKEEKASSSVSPKLQQLIEVLDETRDEYRRARQGGCDRSVLEEKAAAFVKANESVQRFLQTHPDLAEDRLES